MAYHVKEVFTTLQGEGYHTGRAAVFCRFSGCNLWTGREEDRHKAVCKFCDTDFRGVDGQGGGIFDTPTDLAEHIVGLWQAEIEDQRSAPFLVCTGGEPLLQLDQPLVDALHQRDVYIAVETNGTRHVELNIDWVCVSPKAGADFVQKEGDELKLVYPQPGISPEEVEALNFGHFYLQPMDGPKREENTRQAVMYCRKHPRWKLSLQTHKYLNIP